MTREKTFSSMTEAPSRGCAESSGSGEQISPAANPCQGSSAGARSSASRLGAGVSSARVQPELRTKRRCSAVRTVSRTRRADLCSHRLGADPGVGRKPDRVGPKFFQIPEDRFGEDDRAACVVVDGNPRGLGAVVHSERPRGRPPSHFSIQCE
jgi:hypothetical protein